jgi:hypothetical protein
VFGCVAAEEPAIPVAPAVPAVIITGAARVPAALCSAEVLGGFAAAAGIAEALVVAGVADEEQPAKNSRPNVMGLSSRNNVSVASNVIAPLYGSKPFMQHDL